MSLQTCADSEKSIFSMSMFNWGAENGEAVVSKYIWLYFVIAFAVTMIVLGIWVIWYKRTQRKESKREDIELAMYPKSK